VIIIHTIMRTLKPMFQAGEEASRDEDDDDEDGGVVCEVEMEVGGKAKGSVVELEKRMKRKTDLTQEEETQKNEGVETKMF